MVETPGGVIMCDVLTEYADFISIGTNDLTQYILAADRTNEHVAQYYQQFHPSVFRAINTATRPRMRTGSGSGFAANWEAYSLQFLCSLAWGLTS